MDCTPFPLAFEQVHSGDSCFECLETRYIRDIFDLTCFTLVYILDFCSTRNVCYCEENDRGSFISIHLETVSIHDIKAIVIVLVKDVATT